ncbi:GGDEF domain-containing protein [Pseudanabaena sp. FACHB-1998]|uniref:diguanylate cyclase n=1 Tax=Pseudanabaena sp. FACHB-1998 TaxID=2692858 RepID=UPI0016808FCE|nr:diguanylate cyclase [Pseudanabaena sp. FACHB-1998]MBD2175845.1 GGDEF domain-containing protein [Pseudanabaena sp. FACHB-1998]
MPIKKPLKLGIEIGIAILLVLGLLVILGWYTGIVIFIQINPQFVPMQFNTALGFVVTSLAMGALVNHRRDITKYTGLLVGILGGMTLIQHIFGVNLYIDELFMKHYITMATSAPGRMAPNTALNFILVGMTLFCLGQKKLTINHLIFSSLLGSLTLGLSMVALFGYMSRVEAAYSWGNLTKMAIHTAIGFMVVGVLLILETRMLSRQIRQKLPSFTLPITFSFLGFIVTLSLWQALYFSELQINRQYGIKTDNYVATGILIFGGLFSILLGIATWLAIKSQEQLQENKLAQAQIVALNQQLEKLSYLDGLTEIPNRRAFDIAIERELARAVRYQYPIAIIFIDIDYFKAFNDYYGHQLGDACLQLVASAISEVLHRKTDMVARYGGEEFVMLLPDVNLEGVEKVAAMTLQAIADLQIPHEASKVSSYVTISAGLSVCIPDNETSPKALVRLADQALYKAKMNGRNCIKTP